MADDLGKFAGRMRELPARLGPQLADAVADGLKMATLYGYQAGIDVNDKPYIPAKDGHRPKMIRSGDLMRSVNAGPVRQGGQWGGTVRTDVPGDYDQLLISGTAKMEPREHLPSPGQTPPPRFEHALDMTVRPALADAVDKAVR
jgi:hypothetical protein